MKKLILGFVLMLFSMTVLQAQQFLSITPDFGNKGQTISTVVTSSGFFFTWGSVPNTWGDFYMDQNGQQILPSNVTVIDDDHLNVQWPIPTSVPSGNYSITWAIFNPWSGTNDYQVPGGFNVDCVPPPAQITYTSVQFCAGSSVPLQANTGTGLTYQWYFNNFPISGATNSTWNATASGYYKVKVSNAQGCPRFSDPVYTYSIALPLATITPATTQTICQGNSVTLTANSSGTYSCQWFKNGNILNGVTTKIISVSDSGSYTVRITTSLGCTKLSAPVQVNYAPLPPSYINASGPLTFCAGNSVTLKTAAGYTYQWYKYGNAIAGATSRSLTVNTTGVYKVIVTNASGCTKKSGNQNVTVLNTPNATITPVGSTSICAGDSVKLNANNGTGYTYIWKRYGVQLPGALSSSYMAKNGGVYKVVVTNSSGCSKTSSPVTVSIVCREAAPLLSIDNAPDIFPNPASDFINITGQNIQKTEVRDVEGRIVEFNDKGETQIAIDQLPNGLYLVIIYLENDIVTRKFIKQ